jgi:hypothetical protein
MNPVYRNLMPKIDVLNIEWVEIETFERELEFNSTMALELFQTKRLGSNYCFELAVPSQLKNEGVSKVVIQAKFRKLYVYQEGWTHNEMPKVYYKDASKVLIKTEHIHLEDYDGKLCVEDSDYRNDICRREFIQNVSLKASKLQSIDQYTY